nr:MAG TPA: putative transcriptional regulator [Caudoviricetes sp.]
MIKNKIAEIRNEEGITQEELAKMSDISRVALSAIENGTVPNGNTMLNIAKALKRKVENVFYEEM